MPESTAAIVAYLAGTGTAAAAAAGVYTYFQVATVVYGAYSSAQARKAVSQSNAFQGQAVTIRDSDAPKWFVYGRAAPTPGVIYHCVHPADTKFYSVVLDVAHHEIDAFEDVLANNVSIGALGGGVWNGATLAGGLVQPGSRFYKSHTSSLAQAVTWPTTGGTVTLDNVPDSIMSLAIGQPETTGPQYAALIEGVDYSRSGAVLTALNATYAGQPAVVTYAYTFGEPLLRVRFFKGLPAGERDTILEADSAGAEGAWTATDLGKNVARMVLTMKWDADVFGTQGMPEFRAVIRGKKVKDWTDDSVEWSSNSVRAILDYLTDAQGFGVDPATVVLAQAIAAQAACDEQVPITGGPTVVYQSRYEADGVLYTDQPLFDNLATLLTSCAGSACHSAGTWIVRAGVYQIPALTLTDSDFSPRGEKLAMPFTAKRDSFNAVRGRYTDPNLGYQPNTFKPYESSLYIAQDGGETVFKDIELPFTTNALRAQRIAKQFLFRTRNAYRWSAFYSMKAYPLQPGDGAYLQHVRRGWQTMNAGLGKAFAVESRELTADCRMSISFVEDAPEFYAWSFDEATAPDPAPNIALPNPAYVEALRSVRATSTAVTFEIMAGEVVPYVLLTWDAVTDRSVANIVVRYKRASDYAYTEAKVPTEATEYRIKPARAGEIFNVEAYTVNHIGAQSAKALLTHVCSSDLPTFGQVANSANWITNSLFRSGVVGWTLFKNGAARASFFKPVLADQWLGGSFDASPANGVLYNPDPFPIGASPPQLMTNPAPVTPGQGVGAMMSVLPVQCDVSIGLLFLDANNAASGYFVASEVVADHLPGSRTDARKRGDYDTTRVWADAPANSVAVRAFLTMTGPLRGTAECAVYITEPLLGPCLQGDLAGLKWTPGGQGSVGTAVMEVNATNIMYRPQTAIPNAVTTTTSEVSDILMRFTPTEDGQLEVVYECECASQTINGEYTLVAGFSITGVSEAIGAPVIVSAPVLTTPATANQLAEPKGMTRKATFTAVNGQEIVITHYMQRVVTVEYASSKLGIAYTPTSGKRFNGKDAFSDRRLSALLMPKTTAIMAAA